MPVTVGCVVRLPGWHSWPDASDQRDYLAALHRHLFVLTADVLVDHNDREVEFHDLADLITLWWGDQHDRTDRGSCEGMACDLAEFLSSQRLQVVNTTVSEDGEAWATWRLHVPD